jgi:hypothetical protein
LLCDSGKVKSENEEKICEVAVMRGKSVAGPRQVLFLQHSCAVKSVAQSSARLNPAKLHDGATE